MEDKNTNQESTSQMPGLKIQEKRSLALFLLVFILMVGSIAAVGYASYRVYEQQYRSQVESQLSAIASLKLDELQDWRNEHLADASLFFRNDDFSELVHRYLENPADTDARNELASWLELIRVHPEYERVFLLDAQGRERFSVPAAPVPVKTYTAEQVAATLASGQITMLDLHRDTPAGLIHLSILIPIFDESEGNRPLGVLVLYIDPYVYLYPFIQRWPVPSASAETLLVRLDGDDILFLNELRFQSNAALTLRISLEQTEILGVKAVLGQEGVAQGLDYRGVETIGVLQAVPDSPWFLVARIDAVEAYRPLRERLWQTAIFFGALIAAAGTGLMLVWRRQRLHYLQAQVKAQEALITSEAELRALFAGMTDVVIVYDADGRYVKIASTKSTNLYRPTDNVLGKTVHEILPKEQADYIVAKTRAALQSGEVVHGEHSLQIGEKEFWFASSASQLSENTVVWVSHDITERKQAEEQLRYQATLLENVSDAIVASDAQFRLTAWNAAAESLYGWKAEEVLGRNGLEIIRTEWPAADVEEMRRLIADQGHWRGEATQVRKDGSRISVEVSSQVLSDGNGQITVYISANRDITERKQAEAQLNEQMVELQRWHKAMLGRESRILDLKREVNALLGKAGLPPRYPSAET